MSYNNRTMRRLMALSMLLFLTLGGCRREPERVIGVIPKGANHIFWQTVHAGAIKAALESGYKIEWNAPALEIDSSRQIEIVDSMEKIEAFIPQIDRIVSDGLITIEPVRVIKYRAGPGA